MAISSPLLSICPRLSKVRGRLVASTAWRLLIPTLGLVYRQVTVDPKKEEISVYGRYFWILPNDGPWPDWLYWNDYLFDLSGTQERESKAFVELLSKMIGVSVVPARG